MGLTAATAAFGNKPETADRRLLGQKEPVVGVVGMRTGVDSAQI